MCNIWKDRREDLLGPQHMDKLPRELETINLSGGEPFLRADLAEFVRHARNRCPKAQIVISTNALMADRIAERMKEIVQIDPTVHLAVSLDGLGEAHDRIRGVRGIYDAAVRLIDHLAAEGFGGLRLSMTLTADNLDQFVGVAELAARRGLELGVVAAHAATTHLGVGDLPPPGAPDWLREQFERTIAGWLRSWRPKQWLRAHFAMVTLRYLAGQRWRFRCRAGRDFFFLQADGQVYSCSVQGQAMGNLATQSWEEVWQGPAAGAREFSARCPESCWMICTARSVYRRRALQIGWWVLSRKVLSHRGRCKSGTTPYLPPAELGRASPKREQARDGKIQS